MFGLIILYFIIGVIVGFTGIGGVLAIPGMIFFVGTQPHVAIATALASFLFLAIVASFQFHVMGSLDKSLYIPLCIGTLPAAFFGAFINAFFPASFLLFLLGLIIISAGIGALRKWKALSNFNIDNSKYKNILIAICGVIAGIFAGLTGAGGPIISIPLMIMLGISPMLCVTSAMPLQICTSLTGSIGNAINGNIDMGILIPTSLSITLGMLFSSRLLKYVSAEILKKIIGILCLFIGIAQCIRSIM